jgi:hypothetical protein
MIKRLQGTTVSLDNLSAPQNSSYSLLVPAFTSKEKKPANEPPRNRVLVGIKDIQNTNRYV